MESNTQEIKETLEEIRTSEAPHINASIFEKIVDVEYDSQENESRASGKMQVKALIEECVDEAI